MIILLALFVNGGFGVGVGRLLNERLGVLKSRGDAIKNGGMHLSAMNGHAS